MRLLLIAVFCSSVGCTVSSPTPDEDRQGPNEAKNHDDSAHRAKLLEIAANYNQYEKADNKMRFAPAPCAAPISPAQHDKFVLADYRISRSEDAATHGRKLYVAYARNVDPLTHSYLGNKAFGQSKQSSMDEVIVKESWVAHYFNKDSPATFNKVIAPDGKWYSPGAKGPLFVMYQTDPKDPNSDEGWVYGTLTPDGKTVTGVGRLENCMGCHQKAPHGRLFGLPKE